VFAWEGDTHGENWLSLNFNYGSFFKSPLNSNATADNQFGALGAGLTFHRFGNWSNFGIYAHMYFLFPNTIVSTKTDGGYVSEEKMNTLMGAILGPAFRIVLGEGAYLLTALGFHVSLINGTYTQLYPNQFAGSDTFQDPLSGTMLGVGGNFSFKYDTSNVLHVIFGMNFTLDLVSFINFTDENRVKPDYTWIDIKPYIGIGISIISEHSWFARLANEGY
jgi:hypothetical protein